MEKMEKLGSFQRVAKEILDSGMPLWEAERCFRGAVELEALNRTRGHQLKAARLLGVHRNTLGRAIEGTPLRRKARRTQTFARS